MFKNNMSILINSQIHKKINNTFLWKLLAVNVFPYLSQQNQLSQNNNYLHFWTRPCTRCCCTVTNHSQISDFHSNIFLLWTKYEQNNCSHSPCYISFWWCFLKLLSFAGESPQETWLKSAVGLCSMNPKKCTKLIKSNNASKTKKMSCEWSWWNKFGHK